MQAFLYTNNQISAIRNVPQEPSRVTTKVLDSYIRAAKDKFRDPHTQEQEEEVERAYQDYFFAEQVRWLECR
jgi:hypothetical protein